MFASKFGILIFGLVGVTALADGLPTATNTMWTRGTAYADQGYLEYLPAGYGGARPSPLLIFLSGKGQSGPGTLESLDNLGNMGLAQEIKFGRWPTARPFVVLTPQHVDMDTTPTADEIDAFIQFAKAHYRVDTNRIYITGTSRGAKAITNYLAKYGGKDVAAAVPLSGDLSPAWAAQGCALVRDVALFGSHGGRDFAIRIEPDHEAYARFAACPDRRDVVFVIYEEAGHNEPWLYTLEADYDIYAWMLRFKKHSPHPQMATVTDQ